MYTTSIAEAGMIPPQVAIAGRLAQVMYFGAASGYPGYVENPTFVCSQGPPPHGFGTSRKEGRRRKMSATPPSGSAEIRSRPVYSLMACRPLTGCAAPSRSCQFPELSCREGKRQSP